MACSGLSEILTRRRPLTKGVLANQRHKVLDGSVEVVGDGIIVVADVVEVGSVACVVVDDNMVVGLCEVVLGTLEVVEGFVVVELGAVVGLIVVDFKISKQSGSMPLQTKHKICKEKKRV
ncbi:hypothetical protein ACJJTC_005898 [Scirpophaga incertulas]